MKVGIIVESRMASTRLPGKILLPIVGKPALELMVERLKQVKEAHEVIIATTENERDLTIVDFASRWGVGCFRGSEEDVLSRVVGAARKYNLDIIVEITSDCPLADPDIISEYIRTFMASDVDYVANIIKRTHPRGMDVQVFKTSILNDIEATTKDAADREHPSLHIYEHPEKYKLMNMFAEPGYHMPDQRLTLDTPQDYFVIRTVYEELYPKNRNFRYKDIYSLLTKRPDIRKINSHIDQKRPRGYDHTERARKYLGLD